MAEALRQARTEIDRLKGLLFGAEADRLDEIARRLDALDSRVGSPQAMQAATAEVLVGAFKRAEQERHRDLSRALAPLVVASIRSEIANSKDMMVEALYPITGRLVSAAVAQAFRDLVDSLNERIDSLLSTQSWRLRFKAMATGRSVSEVALAEAQRAELQRILFLERHSGKLVAAWSREAGEDKPEIVSGLIAAITDFASDVLGAEGGELRTLDLGGSSVALRSSARMIVAAQYRGKAKPEQEHALDALFTALLAAHEREEPIDQPMLSDAARDFSAAGAEPQKKGGAFGKVVLAGLALLLIGWGLWSAARAMIEWRREQAVAAASEQLIAARPELAPFPLHFAFDHPAGRLQVRGLLPSNVAEADMRARIDAAAKPYVVTYRTALSASQAELAMRDARLSDLEKRLAEATQRAEALGRDLAAMSAAPPDARLTREISVARKDLSALEARYDAPDRKLERLAAVSAVFFGDDDNFRDPEAAQKTLQALADALKPASALLRVVGHADSTGVAAGNVRLGELRARAVSDALARAGAPADRLRIASRGDIQSIGPRRSPANRRVNFEIVYLGEPEP
jgi:outer membrane protein OmpA-like peptidoglycan-associated protein